MAWLDEQRYFAAGDRFMAFDTARFGRVAAESSSARISGTSRRRLQAEEVRCVTNSPAPHRASPTAETYELLAKTFARLLAAMVIVVNRVAFEDRLCFWGRAAWPSARRRHRQPMLDPAVTAAFDPAEFRRQRLIAPLARDERLLVGELNGIREEI